MRKRKIKYEIVDASNYTEGLDHRASVIFFHSDWTDIDETVTEVAKAVHGPVNVIYFNTESDESKELAKTRFKVTKTPAI